MIRISDIEDRNPLTVVVKPTHNCNLRCRYCYIDRRGEKGNIDYSTLIKLMEQSALYSKNRVVHFIWHGGEPLLMGLDFYREVSDISDSLRKRKYKIVNKIQTNGTLVDDELLDFVEEKRDFRLGMSLDGPKYINDKTRIYDGGKGAFDDIFRGVKMVRERNRKRGFHLGGGCVIILNKTNLHELNEIYDFFNRERINIKINPVVIDRDVPEEIANLAIDADEFSEEMIRLFDRWIEEKDSITIDPFSLILGNLMTRVPMGCVYSSCRGNFISIGPSGDVYPCARFSGRREYLLGNIHERDIEEIVNSSCHQRLLSRTADSIASCRVCSHKKICNGGCMYNASVDNDVMNKDPFCRSYKALFVHIEDFLRTELDKIKEKTFLKGGEKND